MYENKRQIQQKVTGFITNRRFKFIEEDMDEEQIKDMSKAGNKQKIKVLVRNASFKVLNQEKKGHKEVKHIVYEDFVIQPYPTSKQFNKR